MNSFKKILIGIALGIILAIVAIVLILSNVVHKAKEDYQDEVTAVVSILEESKEPVFQVDYMLAGLNLSSQFQEYLQEGVAKGWWTEEFITQVLTDDLLPIYGVQYSKTFKALGKVLNKKLEGSNLGEILAKVKEVLPQIIEKLKSMDLEQLKQTLVGIRNKILSLDINRIILAIQNIKNMISHLDFTKIKQIINKIKNSGILDKIEDLKGKIKVLEDKLKDVSANLDGVLINIENIIVNVKEIIVKIKEVISNIDLSDLEAIKDKIKEIIEQIKDKIGDLDVFIANIKHKIEVLIAKIKDFLNDISYIIDDIKDAVEDIINDLIAFLNSIKDWLFEDVKPDFDWSTVVSGNKAILLNALDINILYDTIDDGRCSSLPGSPSTCIYVYNISFTLENIAEALPTTDSEKGGIRYVLPIEKPLKNRYGVKPTGPILNAINNKL